MDLPDEVHAAMLELRRVLPPDDSGVWTGLTKDEAALIREHLDAQVAAAEKAAALRNTQLRKGRAP